MRLFIILLVAICLIATSHTGDQAGGSYVLSCSAGTRTIPSPGLAG
jgi:hypothetical protein